ncbi:ABC transporter ATP-binding protein [Oricola sp.]|uniref:ABC transporter ATP-binding protein n=1 Tax=Oricola sp. TaxID=1979950 RepID=UPI003204D3A3
MLEVSNLSVSYGAHRALEDVSIHVATGEICVILGANGAGKSSLLKTIGGMVRAASGARIRIDGRDITQAKPHKVVEAGLALVPEGRGIFGDLTVAENLQLGAYGPQARSSEAKRREDVLKLFPKLEERRNQIARTMSGGEQQMVAIGRALMSNPKILMLDEPSLGLSPLLTKDLFKSLKAVRETGVGILLVEQNAKQSLAIADRGYLIENGHITGEGTGAELAHDPAVQAAYLGGAAAAPQHKREANMREEHRHYYVPAAAGGQRATAAAMPATPQPSTAVADAAMRTDGAVRAEHRRFYVPAGAMVGGRTVESQPGTVAAQSGPAASRESQGFYVPAGANGAVNGHANGHGTGPAKQVSTQEDAIIVSNQAHDLSRKAAEFAKRAAQIQRHHVEAQRVDHHFSTASALVAQAPLKAGPTALPSALDLSRRAAEMAERASRIGRDHVTSGRGK